MGLSPGRVDGGCLIAPALHLTIATASVLSTRLQSSVCWLEHVGMSRWTHGTLHGATPHPSLLPSQHTLFIHTPNAQIIRTSAGMSTSSKNLRILGTLHKTAANWVLCSQRCRGLSEYGTYISQFCLQL